MTTTHITDEQEDDALRVLRASYWQSVRIIADGAAEYAAADTGTDDDRADALNGYISESVDGSQWVLFTWRARLVRSLSDHDNAYIDDGGDGDMLGGDIDTVITAWAYHAMTADVHGVLDNRAYLAERDAALAAEATT